MNVDKAIAHLRANAKDRSIGLCATYVRKAMFAGGMSFTPINYACNYAPTLLRIGFKPFHATTAKILKRDYSEFKPGDIAVWQASPGQNPPAGHIQMYDGKQWISDFKQLTFYPNSSETSPWRKVKYDLFRYGGTI